MPHVFVFAKSDSPDKTRLSYTFCSSLYASVLLDLQQPETQRVGLCYSWRMALIGEYGVYRETLTHNTLLYRCRSE